MSISDEVVKLVTGFTGFVESIPGAFIVGSFVTYPEDANDIDVVVPMCSAHMIPDKFVLTSRDDPEYDRSDIACLSATYRHKDYKQINLLVVSDAYISAYVAAVEEQRRHPALYKDRAARVDMYHKFEMAVKRMLEGNP